MSTEWSTDVKLYAQRAKSLSALSSCSQELRGKDTPDPFHPSVVPLLKRIKTQKPKRCPQLSKDNNPSKDFKNPVGLQHVNHGFNILAHLAS